MKSVRYLFLGVACAGLFILGVGVGSAIVPLIAQGLIEVLVGGTVFMVWSFRIGRVTQ